MLDERSLKFLRWCIQSSTEEVLEHVQPDRAITVEHRVPSKYQNGRPQHLTGHLAWKGNGARVLAVCHLDHVSQEGEFAVGERHVFGSSMDDRLGLFTMLSYMPSMGVGLDWLFADLEEVGLSTAEFAPYVIPDSERYNWIVEFDRAGDDVVAYQYIDEGLWLRLTECGFQPALGSFTDITVMEDLGLKAINIGIGYEDAHSLNGYMRVDTYEAQMLRFLGFWDTNADVRLAHPEWRGWFHDHAFHGRFHSWLTQALYNRVIHISETGDLARLHSEKFLPWLTQQKKEGKK